jgi:adenylate kinase
MKVILLGCPGSGKGTQAQGIAKHYHIPQISTGDMLRQEIASGSALGRAVQSTMDAGQYVSDQVVMSMVANRIQQDDCKPGFLLDGFPRTLEQAKQFSKLVPDIDGVINLDISDQAVTQRLSGRRVHLASGRVYHTEFNPPQRSGHDDLSGEALVQRKDDTPEVIQQRLAVYHQQTAPLITFYAQAATNHALHYQSINADRPVSVIRNDILGALKTLPTQ